MTLRDEIKVFTNTNGVAEKEFKVKVHTDIDPIGPVGFFIHDS